jgi:hypothetical protein
MRTEYDDDTLMLVVVCSNPFDNRILCKVRDPIFFAATAKILMMKRNFEDRNFCAYRLRQARILRKKLIEELLNG